MIKESCVRCPSVVLTCSLAKKWGNINSCIDCTSVRISARSEWCANPPQGKNLIPRDDHRWVPTWQCSLKREEGKKTSELNPSKKIWHINWLNILNWPGYRHGLSSSGRSKGPKSRVRKFKRHRVRCKQPRQSAPVRCSLQNLSTDSPAKGASSACFDWTLSCYQIIRNICCIEWSLRKEPSVGQRHGHRFSFQLFHLLFYHTYQHQCGEACWLILGKKITTKQPPFGAKVMKTSGLDSKVCNQWKKS